LLGFLASLKQQIGKKGKAGLAKIAEEFAFSRFVTMA
jgi:hypothetical protein